MCPADTALTRERIVAAAEDVIRRFGPAKATVVDVARALGETDGYARVDAAAIPPAADGAATRRIYLLVRDRGGKRWIALTAYDTQSVCVEGRRDI